LSWKKLTLYGLVATTTFIAGIALQRLSAKIDMPFKAVSVVKVPPTRCTRTVKLVAEPGVELREEQWHRLYAASQISGDQVFRKEIMSRTLCMRKFELTSRLDDKSNPLQCQASNGDRYSPEFIHQKGFLDRHEKWLVSNREFLRTIETPTCVGR
jgi:hypothetical protein